MSRIDSGSDVTKQVKDKAAEAGQAIRDKATEVRDAAQEQFQNLRETATEYYDQGREKAMEWEQGIEDYVREQPIKSLLIAAGVGMLLGIVWRRS